MSISEYVADYLSEGRDPSLSRILVFMSESEKARVHLQKLLEIEDKHMLRLLASSCGIQSNEQVINSLMDADLIVALFPGMDRWQKGISVSVGSQNGNGGVLQGTECSGIADVCQQGHHGVSTLHGHWQQQRASIILQKAV